MEMHIDGNTVFMLNNGRSRINLINISHAL